MSNASYSTKTSDVVIIGGGIIGCSIAFRLAKAGLKVTVIDRTQPGSEASGAAAGMIAPQGEMLEADPYFELCKASRDLYPEFVAEVEDRSQESVNYRRDGALLVAINAQECEELNHIYATQTRLGLPLERLTGEAIRGRVAGISPEIEFGLLVAGDHWIDNERLVRALVKAGATADVSFHWDCTVTGFEVRDHRVETIRAAPSGASSSLDYSAGKFVLAAGSWSGQLAKALGMSLLVKPCGGHLIEFEAPVEVPHVLRAGIHYLVPRTERRIVVGTTAKYVGFEKAMTGEDIQSIIQGVSRIAPLVKNCTFRRVLSGLRPDTEDHRPLLGYGELENLAFATGHFRNGILLAPITAKLISELLLTGASSLPIDPYSPRRFEAS